MQEFLLDYLSINKVCFIPGLGALYLRTKPASSIFGEQKIAAPIAIIEFEEKYVSDNTFTKYIAANRYVTFDNASLQIKNVSDYIRSLNANDVYEIPNIGKFYKDENDKLVFTQTKFPEIFLPNVNAIRVVHPNESHHMLVGDTQTSTAAMTEYYALEEKSKVTKWWIWATVLAVIAFAGLVFYLFGDKYSTSFGNTIHYEVITADTTYRIAE